MAVRYKGNGRYAYETHNVWNSEKKKYETKWMYLGVVDETGAYKKARPATTPNGDSKAPERNERHVARAYTAKGFRR